jgi:hypothetical protein
MTQNTGLCTPLFQVRQAPWVPVVWEWWAIVPENSNLSLSVPLPDAGHYAAHIFIAKVVVLHIIIHSCI